MQLTSETAINSQINNAYTTYNSVTGLWNISQNHNNLYGYVYYSRPLAVYFRKNSGGALPSGASENSVYYFFQVRTSNSVHVGFAANCEDAVNKVPMKFPSSGDEFTFVSTGRTYRLRSLYKDCCDEELFDTQLPDSSPLNILYRMPLPDKLPKKITVTISGVAKDNGFSPPSPVPNFGARISALADLINGEWDLYHGVTNSTGLSYFFNADADGRARCVPGYEFVLYQNLKRLVDGYGETFCLIEFKMKITGTSFAVNNVDYEVHIAAKTLVGAGEYYAGLISVSYGASIGLPYDGGNISDSIFSSIPTLALIGGYQLGMQGVPQTLTATPSGNYITELSPPTLTLTKSAQPPPFDTNLGNYTSGYPLRGWTTNDYSKSLPDTITMVKVPGYDHVYESEVFLREINVTNKVRLKLAVNGEGKFNYCFWDRNLEGYEPPVHNYFVGYGMHFVNRQDYSPGLHNDGELELTEPAWLSGAYTKLMLFFMAGTPYKESFYPDVSTAYATAGYYIQV